MDSTATGNVQETKLFAPELAVSQFHDALGYYPGFYWNDDGYLYWWNVEASAVVPAKDSYSTRITWLDKTPVTDFFGIDVGGTVLGSGNPGDDGVQYGVNIAVTEKAADGSWGKLAVWNAKKLLSLSMKVSKTKIAAGQTLTYQLTVRNLGPARQPFSLRDVLPKNTTFVSGKYYDLTTKSIKWSGTVDPNRPKTIEFTVKVNAGTPKNTVLTNTATLTDDIYQSTATVKSTVK